MLSKKQFGKKIGKSERHVERLIERGKGPPTVQTGDRAIGITEEDADAWIEARRKVPPGWNDGLVNFPKPDGDQTSAESDRGKLAGGSRRPPRKSRRRRTGRVSSARGPPPQ
jgi:predicted DNA-binding transcriptional regulator AlpA